VAASASVPFGLSASIPEDTEKGIGLGIESSRHRADGVGKVQQSCVEMPDGDDDAATEGAVDVNIADFVEGNTPGTQASGAAHAASVASTENRYLTTLLGTLD
jgi:hypothetical protein